MSSAAPREALPARGDDLSHLGLVLPPARMPLRVGLRPLKRWRYAGVFGPELMLCVARAHIGGVPRSWWAVALPTGELLGRTTSRRGRVRLEGRRIEVRDGGVEIGLELGDGRPVETASPAGGAYIWTRKLAGAPVRGTVRLPAGDHRIDGPWAVVDDSAGYHPRDTEWRWSAGVGRSVDGRAVGWNLVEGMHDAPGASERTVWTDGVPVEAEPQRFASDLSAVGGLRFEEWAVREEHANWGLMRSDYRQPFGTFAGRLPGGPDLAEGYGVMEWHSARW